MKIFWKLQCWQNIIYTIFLFFFKISIKFLRKIQFFNGTNFANCFHKVEKRNFKKKKMFDEAELAKLFLNFAKIKFFIKIFNNISTRIGKNLKIQKKMKSQKLFFQPCPWWERPPQCCKFKHERELELIGNWTYSHHSIELGGVVKRSIVRAIDSALIAALVIVLQVRMSAEKKDEK